MLYLFYPNLKDVNDKKMLLDFTREVEDVISSIYKSNVSCWGSFAPPYLVIDSEDEEKILDIYSKLNDHLIANYPSISSLVIKEAKPYNLAKLNLLNDSNKG